MSRSLWQQIAVNITKYTYFFIFSVNLVNYILKFIETFRRRVWRSIPGADQECWTSWLPNFDNKALEVIIVQITTYSMVKICAQMDTNTAPFPSIYSAVFSNYFESGYVNIAVMNGLV